MNSIFSLMQPLEAANVEQDIHKPIGLNSSGRNRDVLQIEPIVGGHLEMDAASCELNIRELFDEIDKRCGIDLASAGT